MKPRPVILIDTREQEPLTFRNLPTQRATLDARGQALRPRSIGPLNRSRPRRPAWPDPGQVS